MLYLHLQLLWCHSEGYQWRVKTSENRLLTGCLMFSKLKFISSYNQSVSLQYTQLMTPAIRNSLESHIYSWFKILAYFSKPYKKRNNFSFDIQTPKIYYRAVGYKKGHLVSFLHIYQSCVVSKIWRSILSSVSNQMTLEEIQDCSFQIFW